MDISKANILDHNDLLLFENQSLDKEYYFRLDKLPRKKVTKLMMLIYFLHKYPRTPLNKIIKEYVKVRQDEIVQFDNHKYGPLSACIFDDYLETLEILLESITSNQININNYLIDKWTAPQYAAFFGRFEALKLLAEYDVSIDINKFNNGIPPTSSIPSKMNRINKILDNIKLLNVVT